MFILPTWLVPFNCCCWPLQQLSHAVLWDDNCKNHSQFLLHGQNWQLGIIAYPCYIPSIWPEIALYYFNFFGIILSIFHFFSSFLLATTSGDGGLYWPGRGLVAIDLSKLGRIYCEFLSKLVALGNTIISSIFWPWMVWSAYSPVFLRVFPS